MNNSASNHLAELIIRERLTLLAQWREQVRRLPSAQHLDVPTLNDHIPALLDELAEALESNADLSIVEALSEGSPTAHGLQRLHKDVDIEEIVAEYNILRGCIHELAGKQGLQVQGRPLHIINRVLDQAIAVALQSYVTQRALEVQRRREEYLAFVAHDLRTPLNAIALAGAVLAMKLRHQVPDDETASMLRTLQRNVHQLEALISRILEENANLQTETGMKLERREFDLWPLVQALIQDLHPVAGTASTQLVNQVPDDLVIFADASLIRRVLQNLIGNAIKYTPRGQVQIGASELSTEGVVECWVSDTGAGIAAQFLGKIFDAGETHPEHKEGTGLGLAIVKTIVEAHGGMVTVESQVGVGSKFRFLLPSKASGSK